MINEKIPIIRAERRSTDTRLANFCGMWHLLWRKIIKGEAILTRIHAIINGQISGRRYLNER